MHDDVFDTSGQGVLGLYYVAVVQQCVVMGVFVDGTSVGHAQPTCGHDSVLWSILANMYFVGQWHKGKQPP